MSATRCDNSGDGSRPAVISWRFSAAPRKRSKDLTASRDPHRAIEEEARWGAASRQGTRDLALVEQPDPEISEITAAIDPFLQLPDAMSAEDRSLLHSYLLHVPSKVYGTQIASILNPVRDVSFPISLSSDLTMRWMLIAADGLFTNNRAGGGTRVSLMRRKDQAYRRLNQAIRENNGSVTDGLLGGIIMAGITEARLMDPFASNTHLQGFEAALQARGGVEASVRNSSNRGLRVSHLMPYLVCTPLTSDGEPDDARHLHRFVNRLRAAMGTSGFADFATPGSPLPGLLPLKNMAWIEPALAHPALCFYLRPNERRVAQFKDEAPSYMSLFLITMTFWMVTESGPSAELFVDRLITVLEGSSAFDPHTRAPLLTEQGFMFVVLKAVQDFQQDYGLNMEYEVWPIVSAIDALKAFRALPSQRARKKARCILFYMLSGQVLYPGSLVEDTYDIVPKVQKVQRKWNQVK
ncbi:hypothetical protein BJY00DRAFT_173741 [Aspergillus carlsbadensis]|nr:hypothetical protein BJY00DRAFT_173741 [Aspergillus carlsbadensis]